jgi:hypothetical protein
VILDHFFKSNRGTPLLVILHITFPLSEAVKSLIAEFHDLRSERFACVTHFGICPGKRFVA